MAKSIPSYLRLYNERLPVPDGGGRDAESNLAHLGKAFQRATGWPLRCASAGLREAAEAHGAPPFDAPGPADDIEPADDAQQATRPRAEPAAAAELAAAVGQLASELERTRHALREREAELAAEVPLASRAGGERHLAERLAAVLRGGAEAVSCDAAALYLLNEATSELKLRASWNLPPQRYTDAARPLAGATADLEALAGHAVVLEQGPPYASWNPPEPSFAASVCVPVASSTTPLGTLWVFCRGPRPFSDHEVNLAEVVAGRLAADLEREVLLTEATAAARLKRQWSAAERWQQNQLPRIAPWSEGWEVAGWAQAAGGIGGQFFDWFVRPDDSLAVSVGEALAEGLEGALDAATLRAAVRGHAQHVSEPQMLVGLVNRTLWSASAGERGASLFYAVEALDGRGGGRSSPAPGRLSYASAGHAGAYHISAAACRPLSKTSLALGLDPASPYPAGELVLEAGEALLVASESVRNILEAESHLFGDSPPAQALVEHLDAPAATLAELVRDRLEALTGDDHRHDGTVLVVKRHDGA